MHKDKVSATVTVEEALQDEFMRGRKAVVELAMQDLMGLLRSPEIPQEVSVAECRAAPIRHDGGIPENASSSVS